MHSMKTLMTGITAATLVAISTPDATAQVAVTPTAPRVTTERESVRPNLPLMGTGLVTLALGYAPAVGVAIQSDHKGDEKLFIPVVGPWLDMGQRGCDTPLEVSCGSSGIETAALIADGVVQGLGALQIVAGLMTPQHKTVVVSAHNGKPRLQVAPSSLGGRGYGLFATGSF